MRDADLALVTLVPGAERIMMPSKTYSALVAGQAILAVAAPDSDLAALVKRHDCGWIVPPGEVTALRTVLEAIVRNPQEVLAKRHRAYAAGHQHYSVRLLVKDWIALLGEVESRPSRGDS
jgi:colanic acid biosynthesis glycosyl transferase WcaI